MFRIDELIRATSGQLLQGNLRAKVSGVLTDSRSLKPGSAFLALRGKNFDGHDFIAASLKAGARCLIIEKIPASAIPPQVALIRVKDASRALGDIARFHRLKIDPAVIAVTGSNGKTTAKEMIAWVLSADSCVLKTEGTKNNQVGLPQTLLKLVPKNDIAVLEIGTNHFGEVEYLAKIALADIGVITNVGSSHLEFLKDLKGVAREKTALLNNLSGARIALINGDDRLLRANAAKTKTPAIFTYGLGKNNDFSASRVKLAAGKVSFRVNSKYDFTIATLGTYNIYNALAAIAAGRLLGLSYGLIRRKLSAFKFPAGRLKLLKRSGLNFIDDTYNSNPLSMQAALQALAGAACPGRKVLVMGDMLELGAQKELLHRQIGWSITNSCDFLVTVGNLARLTAEAARQKGFVSERIFCCDNAAAARQILFKKLPLNKGDLVLVKGSRSMKMEEIFSK